LIIITIYVQIEIPKKYSNPSAKSLIFMKQISKTITKQKGRKEGSERERERERERETERERFLEAERPT
jgi:hypothetical protein